MMIVQHKIVGLGWFGRIKHIVLFLPNSVGEILLSLCVTKEFKCKELEYLNHCFYCDLILV